MATGEHLPPVLRRLAAMAEADTHCVTANGDREFADTTGSGHALDQAAADAWTGVSVKDDWDTVF